MTDQPAGDDEMDAKTHDEIRARLIAEVERTELAEYRGRLARGSAPSKRVMNLPGV